MAGRSPAGRGRAAHIAVVGLLCAVLAVQYGKHLLPLRGSLLVLLAALAAAALVVVHQRWAVSRTLLRLMAIGPLVFALLFVFASPSSPLILGGRNDAAGGGVPTAGAHPPIVVLVLDELPQLSLLNDDGELDAERFPNFARLAADSTWYRNATTVDGGTKRAVPGMLTGRIPGPRVIPHYTAHPDNLFTLLAPVYDVRAQEGVTDLLPPQLADDDGTAAPTGDGLRTLVGQSAAVWRQVASPWDSARQQSAGFAEPTAGDVAQDRAHSRAMRARWGNRVRNDPLRFRRFVDQLRPAPRPTLHYAHLLLPHRSFRYLPSGMRYEPSHGVSEEMLNATLPAASGPMTADGIWFHQLTRQRHLLQVRYVDHLLGMMLRQLHDSGLYDDAVVVVTADHGIAFTPGLHWRIIARDQANAAEIAWVPLFVKAPHQRTARVDRRNVLQIDLLPTLADYAGLSVPWPIDGASMLRAPRPDNAKPFRNIDGGPTFGLDSARGAAAVLAGTVDTGELPRMRWDHLVGQRVSELAGIVAEPAATVSNARDLAAADPTHGTVPAFVYGTVADAVSAGAFLAIAVNGVVGAVVPVLPRGRTPYRFAGLVTDERLFVAGRNRIALYLLEG